MKLTKIYFDAFKSLLNKELIINDNCLGLVGINESGKSNLLYAISVLNGDRKLSITDTPKMENKKYNPSLRFDFELTNEERILILEKIQDWTELNTLIGRKIKKSNFNVTYHISYDKKEDVEKHSFSLTSFKLNDNYLILSEDYKNDLYKIMHKETFKPLKKAIIVTESDIKADEKRLKIQDEIKKYTEDIETIKVEIENANKNITEIPQESAQQEKTSDGKQEEHLKNSILKNQEELKALIAKKLELEALIKEFDLPILIGSVQKEIEKKETENIGFEEQISSTNGLILKLKKIAQLNASQKQQKVTLNQQSVALKARIIINTSAIEEKKKEIELLGVPLVKKYSTDKSILNNYFSEITHDTIESLLPKVVFWKHDKAYILESETLFSNLLSITELNLVSRPLVNVFRIGLEIKTINDLHNRIKEIQADPNERSKLTKKLNRKVNEYIKGVWPEYDQDINITLENDRIRIEVYDPEYDDASYYNMEERSQGAQTFMSFLLTIGAEAKQGVIKDTILLLDEPETHLHPSGVRFLLKELIKISSKGNLVIYATHSTFMIDNDNYSRHIILEKEKEQTIIKPSNKDRIGFFMQEEVLYSTLDINLEKEVSSTKRYNFVFEGDGDAIIFQHFYSNVLKTPPFPLENTSYYHGGGCNNIKKYLKHRPIQLGTTWIFVLDSDSPANQLRKFIEKKYKDYMNKDIYVFQYENGSIKSPEIELEDILPNSIILDSYQKTAIKHEVEFDEKELLKLMKGDQSFIEYNKTIMENHYKGNGIDLFKGEFKEILNNEVSIKLSETKDEKTFNEIFPEFLKWSTEVISEIETSKKGDKK